MAERCCCGAIHTFARVEKRMSGSGTDDRTYRTFGLAPGWLTIEEAAPPLGMNNPSLRDKLSESRRGGPPGKWVRFRHTTDKGVLAIRGADFAVMYRERLGPLGPQT